MPKGVNRCPEYIWDEHTYFVFYSLNKKTQEDAGAPGKCLTGCLDFNCEFTLDGCVVFTMNVALPLNSRYNPAPDPLPRPFFVIKGSAVKSVANSAKQNRKEVVREIKKRT